MTDSLLAISLRTLLWALSSTLLAFFPAIALAYLLARKDFFGKRCLSALFSLPAVLPPTAIGYLLLRLLADQGLLGRETLGFDVTILFTWKAILLACSVMAFPLIVRTARISFEAVDPQLERIGRSLGYAPWQCFYKITLPLAVRGLFAAAILGFTRAMGEFGASIMIAGNIPGRTQTIASALYSAQQSGHNTRATHLLLLALLLGFVAVYSAEYLARPKTQATNP
jgi:molybdate transport system permease protein